MSAHHKAFLVIGLGLLLAGCGKHRPTYYVSATGAPVTSGAAGSSTAPASSASAPGTSGGTQGGGTAPVSTSTPAPTPASPGDLVASFRGPGPARVAEDAADVTALALSLAHTAASDLTLRSLTVHAAGSLDDAAGIVTCRLALDSDGDGAFDPLIDRTVASGAFQQDDGAATFQPAGVVLAPQTPVTLLVALELSGAGQTHQTIRLRVEPSGVVADDAAGTPARATFQPFAGPLLRLGRWVSPHEAFGVPGEGLRPRVARDAQGRTHVGLFQNHNMNSDVFYTLFDGRRWTTPDGVSRTSNTAWNHDLAVDSQGLPRLVWEEWDNGPGDVGVRTSVFDAQAFAWTPSERISPGSGDMNVDPRVVIAPTQPPTVHVVWEHWPAGGPARLHYRRHDGQGWSQIAEVSSLVVAQGTATDPSLALLPSGEVLIAWAENDPTRSEIRARRVDPQGAFAPVEVVWQSTNFAARTELLSDGAAVHLLYEDNNEVVHQRRDAQGTWSRPVDVSRSPAAGSGEPGMAIHQGVLQVVWVEDATQVVAAEAQGGGFSRPEALTDDSVFRATPVLVSEGPRLRAIWQDRSLGRQRVYTSWREDGPLEAPLAVATPGGDPSRPAAVEDVLGGLDVAFAVDAGGNSEVFVARRDPAGDAFTAAENVSRSPGGSYKPSLATTGDRLWAAWEEDAAGGFTIRAAVRDANGWSAPAAVSTRTPAYAPALAPGPNGPTLVWTSRTPAGDFDLRLARHDGQAWSAPVDLAPQAGSDSWNPAVARADHGTLAVVWEEESSRREVLVATLAPGGVAQVAAVASTVAGQYAPRVAWHGQDLHVVWAEDGRVRAAVRPAGQAHFDAPHDLTQGGSWAPDVAVADGLVTVSWEQWQGGDARVLQATLSPQGWSGAVALDLGGGPSRRVSTLGTARGGVRTFWSEPGRIVGRERRSR
jgi:hypothetical protein